MVINLRNFCLLDAVLSHYLVDKLESVLKRSLGLNLHHHGNLIKLGLITCVYEVILILAVLIGIKTKVNLECATLNVKLCTLDSTLVKGLEVPACSCLNALECKKVILNYSVIGLYRLFRLNKSGHEGGSVTNRNNNTVYKSYCVCVFGCCKDLRIRRSGRLSGSFLYGSLFNGSFLNGSLFNGCFFNRSFFYGSFLNGSFLYGSFFNGSFLYGSFLYGSLFNGCFFNGSFLYGCGSSRSRAAVYSGLG